MPPDPTCIYCKASGVTFNREHVIPQAFGTFANDPMVLENQVCQSCNSSLGSDLDQILARDSYEALLRPLTPTEQGSGERFQPRRYRIRFPDTEHYGECRGARLTMDWDHRKPMLLDQILIRTNNSGLHSLTADEFETVDDDILRDRVPQGAVILGTNPEAVTRLIKMAEARGIQIVSRQSIEPPAAARGPLLNIETEGFIDPPVWRAISKIAFNYLAHEQGAQYVLGDKFDAIRDFIMGRHQRRLVGLLYRPILTQESYNWRAFEGHLVVFETEGRVLKGKVSLYNTITYEVILCTDLGLFYRLNSGHAFDPVQRRVSRIINTPLSIYRYLPRLFRGV